MAKRKGQAKGKGRGYKNLPNFPKDPKVHSDSSRGIKQPQRLGYLSVSKPINIILRDLQNFKSFSASKSFPQFLRSNRRVTKYNNTFIKITNSKKYAEQESKTQNILSNEFDYYPRAIVIEHDGVAFVLTHEVRGTDLYKPISKLKPFQKIELAKVTRFLYNRGYVDFDLRKDNLVIDFKKRPVIVDFDKIIKVDDKKNLEMQYNLNILSIFGFRDKRANQFLTLTQKELGIR